MFGVMNLVTVKVSLCDVLIEKINTLKKNNLKKLKLL